MWKIPSTVCPTVIEFRSSTANYFLMDYSNIFREISEVKTDRNFQPLAVRVDLHWPEAD